MIDLHEALEQISSIRSDMARGIQFRGYGPTTHATTGLLAVASAAVQARWIPHPLQGASAYLVLWTATAALAVALIGIETITRARRIHSGLAVEMLHSAVEPFLPALVAGILLTVVFLRCAPQELWMLPGLWQVIFSLGVFSSCRFLPRATFAVGVWYLAAGSTCLALGQGSAGLAPWEMGIPFGVGQVAVAVILLFRYEDSDEQG